MGRRRLCRRCLRAAGDAECSQYEEMYRKYREYFSETCMYKVVPYEDSGASGKALKQQASNFRPFQQAPCPGGGRGGTLFPKSYFDAVQGQTDSVPRKPSPIGANRLAEHFRAEKKDCLYIGDTATDMETGKAAEMETVGVLWGFRDRKELEESKACHIAEKPENLLLRWKRRIDR